MAKTTRKTAATTEAKKPVTPRKKAADKPEGAAKATNPRRTKTVPEAAAAGRTVESSAFPELTHDEIALRAWSIYERRGGGHGQAMEDWFQAKAELIRERGL